MGEVVHYDAVIVGAGQPGKPLAMKLTAMGWKTALVERSYIGGACINVGCTPAKTIAASARIAHLARRAGDYGVHTGPVTIDMAKVRQRKRDLVASFRDSAEQRVAKAGVTVLRGEASFVGPHVLEVALNDGGIQRLTAEKIFIDVGLRPFIPPLEGLADVPFLDSTSVMELETVPDHLLILGGGYIGIEFGQMFQRFGSRVTIVESAPQVLAHEDRDMADAMTEILREDGIEVLVDAEARRVVRGSRGELHLKVHLPEQSLDLVGSHLLVATGRVPATDRLNLSAAGVAVDARGYVVVNGGLETNVPGVYAMGDVKGGPAFTSVAYDDYRVLRTNLLGKGGATIENRLVPYTVYTDPQLGGVGMTEAEARSKGRQIKVARMLMKRVARAVEMDEARGVMKVIIDAETDQILGAAILGMEGGEMMSVLQMAIMGGLPYTTLENTIYAHPTLAESLNNLFSGL